MPENIVPTPAAAETPVATPAVETPVVETTQEKTVAQIVEETAPEEKPEPKKPDTVGLDKFLDVKNENKDLRKTIKDLEDKITQGASKAEVTDDIAALADEFDVDPTFLSKLSKLMQGKVKDVADATVDERLKPQQKKERDALIDTAFQTHYTAALAAMPEYAEVANASVIKALSLMPANKDKTFPQIIEETYGKAVVPGTKRSIESTRPGGGKEPEPLDVNRARKDTEYFKEVMANPTLKKQYNEVMLKTRM